MLKHFKYKKNLKVNYDMYLLKSTLDYVKPFKLNLILIIILLFFSMIFSTIQPLLFGQIIDAIANKDFNLVIKVLLIIACLFFINLVLNIIQRYLVTITGAKIEMNVKERVLESILGLKISEFSSVQHGEFINKLENDVRAFSNILTQKLTIIIDLISVLVIGIILFKLNLFLTGILLILFPISLSIFRYFGKKIRKEETELKKNLDEYFTFLQECLSGFKFIKLFNIEKKRIGEFNAINHKTYSVGIKKTILNIKAGSITELVNFVGYVLLIVMGAYQIFIGRLTLGGLVAFNSYSSTFTNSLFKLTQLNAEVQEILVSLKRIIELTEKYKGEKKDTIEVSSIYGEPVDEYSIVFRDVSFRYREADNFILHNLNFDIKPHKITAIIGESGSGKSTLLNLIAGLYDKYEGVISLGGRDIKQMSWEFLNSKVCFITQENYIFSQSIKENLLLANPLATMEDLIYACKKVNIHEYIDMLPDKYETNLGFNGIQLSKGQQQRISIAQAILRQAEIYLFDEITSALDKENEKYVYKFIKELGKNKTVVLISHKESTLEYVDEKIFIKNKEVVGVSNELNALGI